MKIGVAFQDKVIGYGTNLGDEVEWEGDVVQLKSIASRWEKQGYKGEALLKKMLERLRGHMWAQQLEETATG